MGGQILNPFLLRMGGAGERMAETSLKFGYPFPKHLLDLFKIDL